MAGFITHTCDIQRETGSRCEKKISREPFRRVLAHDGVEHDQSPVPKLSQTNTRMKTKFNLHLLILALASLAGFARAQGPAFSYQGRLDDGGLPATGLYDFTFNVFDVDVAGVALAGPLPFDAVPVTNGLFTVTLDFGPGLFTGPARWLEITVRTNGVGVPDVLAPRTPLLPTPYSIFAGQAAGVVNGGVTAGQLNIAGAPPTAGQFLSYDGGNFLWADPGVAVGNIWSLNGNSAFYNAGNVGIGINSPASKLTVSAAGYGIEHTDGTRRLNTYVSASGGWLGTLSNDPLNFFVNGGAASMTITPGGSIGVGTTTPSTKLTLRTGNSPFTGYGFEHTDGTVRLTTFLDGLAGWLGTRSNHPLNFFVNNGLPTMAIDAGGNVFITPNGGLGGYGSTIFGAPNGESGMSIRGGNRADIRFNGSSLKLVAGPGTGPPSSFSGVAVSTTGNVGIGTDAPVAKLDVRGTTRTCVLTITGGCDLAEPFPTKEKEVEKGSVMVIDDEHPGRLKLSTQACDTRVAGIISGANGVNPGITLQQDGTFDQGQNVALSGRVYVKADATQGAIKPGDLLTTSNTPGHAMKVSDHSKAQGAILGKAMTALPAGQGLVLVLVTLQ
jgi:hypothetical protein